MADTVEIQNRRYIGSKAKLLPWIFETIQNETKEIHSFCDIFAGTGVVANEAIKRFDSVIVNDLLFSNQVIYTAFWGKGRASNSKVQRFVNLFNSLDGKLLPENFFSENYSEKFFDTNTSKKIGCIREIIENEKDNLTSKEYCILLTILMYGMDKIANTLGHYEAYIHKQIRPQTLILKPIFYRSLSNVHIYRQDANKLAFQMASDLVYIDPPYNSRQYSRFYHIYETLVKWDKPKLSGSAMKPPCENMSEYCSCRAKRAMENLVQNLKTKYLVVSYNNTYQSKSSSSQNKIKLDELESILETIGKTKIFEHSHQFFNAGKTDFKNHKELLFVTEVQ